MRLSIIAFIAFALHISASPIAQTREVTSVGLASRDAPIVSVDLATDVSIHVKRLVENVEDILSDAVQLVDGVLSGGSVSRRQGDAEDVLSDVGEFVDGTLSGSPVRRQVGENVGDVLSDVGQLVDGALSGSSVRRQVGENVGDVVSDVGELVDGAL
ncbi:uncharacterized protein LAESUDRAFT_717216 [Laetiporus sulphureus 93-53]|uniref:Uncharacterized protein n=1 Tax=Laetiporus sulphureus 93-53 TaxID=1314785 RepID=A0A165BYA3_9APHY|nr:uncharacterized protein LAESUDRAFT_717216 [Laetiporus sulphureus 93-53]KZT01869.1 hypothetical protein LAESUDRAFT_717216 [Laetiporus sulphureus 93-53]